MSRLFYPKPIISSGSHQPLGATPTREGINFALLAPNATKVELLLWQNSNLRQPTKVLRLSPTKNKTGSVWHILIQGLPSKTHYAYRVDGPSFPGNAFDFQKVLLDPYAKAIETKFYSRELACYQGDNVENCLRGIIITDDNFDWEDDKQPKIADSRTVIYELHVKGFTKHPSSQVKNPGTFAGLIEKLPYLKELGVTALELMPVLAFDDDIPYQNTRGDELDNYWGYSPMSFFSLHHGYFSNNKNDDLTEFKNLVKKAHQMGMEIILDVVYNHTTESDQNGPKISWRGIDNQTYYLLAPDKNYYMNFTGCGNTLRTNYPMVAKMIVDSLEYLAQELHIDGFRFDLGAIFYYKDDGIITDQPLVIDLINKSPILRELKLISEPWDASGLVLEGRFGGPDWLEWNGSLRDRMRKVVNFNVAGEDIQAHLDGHAPEMSFYQKNPVKSVNFITSHDGFTLRDLVSYDYKHNEENGFHNQDGSDNNSSKNYGIEGETNDQRIINLRKIKAWAMLELATNIPGALMILMGDEMWRTQGGNNNAFCQDNSISWLDWSLLSQNQNWWQQIRRLILAKSQQ